MTADIRDAVSRAAATLDGLAPELRKQMTHRTAQRGSRPKAGVGVADVTHLHPQVEHFEPCDRDVYGRAVVWYMQGDPDLITAENIRAFVQGWRGSGEPCGCLQSRINAAKDLHRRLKLMFEAQLSDANAAAVVAAKAELDRLRSMA